MKYLLLIIMGKKKKSKKANLKKANLKKEKYAKFRKDKPTDNTFHAPDLTSEEQKQRNQDEIAIGTFLKFNRSKKDHTKGIGGKRSSR